MAEDKLDQYLSVLNEEQRAAVVHEGSPLLILAGAGSGKTRVITKTLIHILFYLLPLQKKLPTKCVNVQWQWKNLQNGHR